MATVDELTMNYTEDGLLKVKELDKEVLSKGAWATIMYKYQDWDAKANDYGPIKFSVRRYQKRNNEFSQRSKFNISSVDQARKMVAKLEQWIAEEETN